VKNPLPGNMITRLRMYKVLLFKFGRLLCKGLFAMQCKLKINDKLACSQPIIACALIFSSEVSRTGNQAE